MKLALPEVPAHRTGWPWTTERALTVQSEDIGYPKITVITPSYQHGYYLEETMRSVLMQDYPNLEYIVIDGGSRDETVGLLQKYNAHLSYWVSEPDQGHAHAVNKGFARSTGDILAWLNAGDFYFPQALRSVAEAFQCFADIEWLTSALPGLLREGQSPTANFIPGFSRSFFKAGGYLGFEPFALDFIQQESTFWRRSLWEKTGGELDEALSVAHDFELWNRFFAKTGIALLDAPLGCFRSHTNQRSVTQRDIYTKEAWAVLGRDGNHLLAAAFRLFHQSRLSRLMSWRSAMSPFYSEKISYLSRDEAGHWQRRWRQLL